MTITVSKPSYLPGSDEDKPPEREVKSVVSGKVKPVKKPARKRFMESIGVEDGRTVGDYLIWDVILPAMKDTISEVFKKGIDAFLYGNARPYTKGNIERRGGSTRISYNSYYDRDGDRGSSRYTYHGRAVNDFRDFVFEDRRDAEAVLSEMVEIVSVYGFCKVSDFYSLVGETERNFTDHNYGWEQLGRASVERTRDGWIVDLPRPISLK